MIKKFKGLIFLIDDLDLVDNTNINRMLDDIQRYFSNNVYVLLAYRHKQLFNSILDKKLGDNRELLTKGYIADGEIFEQTAKYIEKILPVTQQVFLNIENNSAEDILKNIVIDCADTEGIGSIEEFILNKIKETTNIEIKPIDQRENTQYIFPTTLRNFLKQVQFLEGLELMDESKKGKSIEKIINNIKSYYTYYYNKISSELSVDLMCIVDDWNSVNNDTKNLTLVAALINKMEKDNIVFDENIKIIAERQAYNIMMGDVFQVMEIFKEKYRGDVVKSHFIYSLKVLYQAKLLLALHSYQLNENKEDLYDYLDLINGKIIPNNFVYSRELISGNAKTSLIYQEEYKEIQKKLFYSNVSAKGKVRAEGYDKSLKVNENYHSFKYRFMFSDRIRTVNEGNLKKIESMKRMWYNDSLEDLEILENLYNMGELENLDVIDKLIDLQVIDNTNIVNRLLDEGFLYDIEDLEHFNNIGHLGELSSLDIKEYLKNIVRTKDIHILKILNLLIDIGELEIIELIDLLEKNILSTNYAMKQSYLIDPFSLFLKEEYIVNQINNLKNYEMKYPVNYIFYSLFDIDIFVRKNYFSESKKNPITYIFGRVNSVFENERISKKIFRKNIDANGIYKQPFSNNDIIFIEKFWTKVKVEANIPTTKSDIKKAISIIEKNYYEKFNQVELTDLNQIKDYMSRTGNKADDVYEDLKEIFNTNEKIKILNKIMKEIKQ